MTQDQLEQAYNEVYKRTACGFLGISDEDLRILLAYETWADGSDWDIAEVILANESKAWDGHRCRNMLVMSWPDKYPKAAEMESHLKHLLGVEEELRDCPMDDVDSLF
jgi:hypothetical protein